jgi:hypothetical protein
LEQKNIKMTMKLGKSMSEEEGNKNPADKKHT